MANEDRLINANTLKARFKLRIDWLEKDVHDEYSAGLYHGAETDVGLVDEMPTVDAVEVIHSAWRKEGPYQSSGGGWKKALICPECNSWFVSDGNIPWQHHNYCPNCGAKMDGDGNGS